MSDQNQTTPATGASQQDGFIEIAAEVKIPINECFISLSVPTGFFKEDTARRQALIQLRTALQDRKQLLPQLEQVNRSNPFNPMGFELARIRSEIAGMQAAVAGLETPLHPQLFLVETYNLTTLRTGTGKGPRIQSITLLPGEEQTFEVRQSFKESTDLTKTTTVMESQDTAVAKNFNDHVAAANAKSGSKDSADYRMDANFHGDASIGLGSGEADASLGVKGGSNEVRTAFGEATESATDKQIAETSASRRQTVSEQKSESVVDKETVTVNTRTIKNPNPTHTLNVFWFQLLEQYTSFLSLVNVEVAFRTGDPTHDRQVPLHDLDQLLNEVLDPSKVSEVRESIKGELEVIHDFQDEAVSIVEEVPFGPNHTILRLKKNLHSTFVLKDVSGNPRRNINVEGVLLKALTRAIPSRLLVADLVVGESSAV